MVEASATGAGRDYAFGVLGPLQVTRGGVALSLGGRQQRAVLARLLLADGVGLTVDQLADALWGEQVPVGAASTIQTYVFHLRQVLEPDRGRGAPGQVVVTDNGRYRLAVPPEALDAVVFERGVDRGERLLAGGAPSEAANELDQALALWRGALLADLADYEFVAPVATRLADRRKAAIEAKIDAELALGRHASVLSQLNELVARDPLNEGLHRQRIIALYRCGRQADALAAYDQLRHQLADELGVDPSPPLQRLQQQVLAHDPALAWHPSTSPGVEAAPPEPVAQTQPVTEPRPRPRRRRPWLRTRWLVVAVILAVVAAAGVVAAVVVSNRPKHTLAALPANNIGIIDADGALRDAVPVGQNPTAMAYGFGSLWIANSGERSVQRVNPKTHEVIQKFPVGANPTAIAMSAQNVWVANGSDGTVTEIDPALNEKVGDPIPVGALPAAIAAGPRGVWVANSGDDNLSLIDIDKHQVQTAVPAGDGPDGLLVDGDSLWVANGVDGTLSHLDARTGGSRGNSVRVDAGAADVLLAHGALWVANKSALSVMQVDPLAERVTGTITVGDGPGSLAATRDAIWVTNEYDGTVSRIDPKAKAVVRTYAVGASPHGIAVAGKDLWLTSTAFTNTSHRGGTLTFIAADSEFLDDVDPAIEANPEVAIVVRGVYDGLVAHRATAGAAGVALVPDLAVALPTPENGGRTYTFKIRKDIRYSNGDPVNASDFQRGLVRELTVGQDGGYPDLYSAIIGAPACIADPKHCDLNAGVTVDNHARLITFHLSHADPGFLDKLTQLVVATPPGAPSGKAVKPIPSTGPYQISKFVKGQLIELQRNPYFKQWSYAAQPDGYPDEIRYVKGRSVKGGFSAEQAADRADIIAGSADVMRSFINDEATNKQLHARYGTQLHDQVRFDTQYLTLNVNIPPFNNRDARRAINYAVDRKKLAQTYGGESAAHPTCQVLPPGFPGYVAYCPYQLDVARAKSLVAASGTAGMTVDFYGSPYDSARLAYVASVLKLIGYRPVVHIFSGRTGKYLQFIHEPSNRVQMGILGWIPDYPRPDAYFDFLFTCDAGLNNSGGYCQHDVDDLIAQAKSKQLEDPPEALSLSRQIDRRIVDDAAIVPMVNMVMNVFTSTKVGNVETTPILVFLIDQMWVR